VLLPESKEYEVKKHWHGSGGDSEFPHIFAIGKEAKAKQSEE
jgi:hypothetical protein